MKTFGSFAKERSRRLGRNQKTLAEQLGVSPAYVSQIFTGKKNPPDLGRPRNRAQLRTWAEFLAASEDEILDLVRFELHRVPPRPSAKFPKIRELLLKRLNARDKGLMDEVRSMELHPAENRVIQAMVQIYMILQEEPDEGRAYSPTRFKEFCNRARSNREFIDEELVRFLQDKPFSWAWDSEVDDVRVFAEASTIREAMETLAKILSDTPGFTYARTIPMVGHVSAGMGFEFTDGGFAAGEGFEQVEIPPGVDPSFAQRLYCVRVRGDSLQEFFGDGTLLFIKPESWEEVKDGDLVIFKNRSDGRAFVKKVEFVGESLLLKSMNPMYKNIVLAKRELMLLERVMAIVL
ncbi:MAG: helix-turn-helix transcriptional regulator [Desulfomonile tiedjei]|nr:helix-turn-helix transcriptional regulator [Desulfomonile tiedjei]